MKHARRIAPVFLGAWLASSACAQDPNTETVADPPGGDGPATYAELTYHAPPRPLPASAVTEDWPGFLGPRRDSHSRETGLTRAFSAGGPPLVWEMESGQGVAAPAVSGDRLVFTHRRGDTVHVDCLDAETGRRWWRTSFPCDYRGEFYSDHGPRSTPEIHAGRVYVQGIANVLRCLDLETGDVVWERDIAADFGVPEHFFGAVASPLVLGDVLVQSVGAPGGPCVAAFDLATGETRWGAGDEWGPSCASPVAGSVHGEERVLVLAGGKSRPPTGGLLVVDPAEASVVTSYPFRSRTYYSVNASSPVLVGDTVFLSSSYGMGSAGIALLPDGGHEQRWRTERPALQFSNPVLVDDHLYAVDGKSGYNGAVVCLEPTSGKELAREELFFEERVGEGETARTLSFSIGEGSLLAADGDLLCLGDMGHLLWLEASPEGIRVLQKAWLFGATDTWTPLALSRGLLYVCQNTREHYGGDRPPRLLCYDLRGEG